MPKLAIVEDDDKARAVLLAHLRRYERENGLSLDITAFADGKDIVAVRQGVYDIILLDIEMPYVDGMTAAKQIRQVDDSAIIIFITNSPNYAIKGYEVAAMSYLLKPLSYFALAAELDRCMKQVSKKEREYLMLNTSGERHRIDVADVIYVESQKHRVTVHTLDREYTVISSLKAIEAELADKGFFRSNNCYLVGLRHVLSIQDGAAVMQGGDALQISRPRKKEFLNALSSYLEGATQ